jgi:hypothetical protein
METSAVRRRVTETIERARRTAAERRASTEAASRDYSSFLDTVAVPLFRQIAGALKAEGHLFAVNTPGRVVRLASEKHGEDFIELSLDTSGDAPTVLLHTSRMRGRHQLVDAERPIGTGSIAELSEDLLLEIIMKELEPFVEK